MTVHGPSGTPEPSRELQGTEKIISNLKAIFPEALSPKMEKLLRGLTESTLRQLEALLNQATKESKERTMQRFTTILNRQ